MIIIGTRGSKLALWQANLVQKKLADYIPESKIALRIIRTSGDNIQDRQLASVGGKGLFVKEIEEALLSGDIDLAVHSMKDVPSVLPDGLHIGAVLEREDPRDVLISREKIGFFELPGGSRVGTGSLRRQVQINFLRYDLQLVDIRGNVDTRLLKLQRGEYDAIVLASAGINRLGLQSHVTEVFDVEQILPSPGQGIIGIECRKDDSVVNNILKNINDRKSQISVTAERDFVKRMGGDCNLPIACVCRFDNDDILVMTGLVASIDGRRIIKHNIEGTINNYREISEGLANIILGKGGKEIVDSYR